MTFDHSREISDAPNAGFPYNSFRYNEAQIPLAVICQLGEYSLALVTFCTTVNRFGGACDSVGYLIFYRNYPIEHRNVI